jgi:hypothetical protein
VVNIINNSNKIYFRQRTDKYKQETISSPALLYEFEINSKYSTQYELQYVRTFREKLAENLQRIDGDRSTTSADNRMLKFHFRYVDFQVDFDDMF